MQNGLVKLATDTRTVFEKEHQKIDDMGIPFFYSFPKNACWGSSILVSMAVQQFFPDTDIKIVLGGNRKNDDFHYWLEIDKKVYDLTVDQFISWIDEQYNCPDKPIYAEKKHPLAKYFFYKQRFSPVEAYSICYKQHANERDVIIAYSFLKNELNKLGWDMPRS
ncbi:hypothetical protein [Xenorhabdus anantnagensis]|uniref:Uncharacterized protein n=1 Tax=Xenorhabdus anantnagensis TaxID=3025875 RepID=A0ABT5LS07_9GAMM|nr:hypothetical protein [Xenorhabdus anantnagensis]MDC9597210.1 hypothetical protein [Xenorhabdus anantnagensis]